MLKLVEEDSPEYKKRWDRIRKYIPANKLEKPSQEFYEWDVVFKSFHYRILEDLRSLNYYAFDLNFALMKKVDKNLARNRMWYYGVCQHEALQLYHVLEESAKMNQSIEGNSSLFQVEISLMMEEINVEYDVIIKNRDCAC